MDDSAGLSLSFCESLVVADGVAALPDDGEGVAAAALTGMGGVRFDCELGGLRSATDPAGLVGVVGLTGRLCIDRIMAGDTGLGCCDALAEPVVRDVTTVSRPSELEPAPGTVMADELWRAWSSARRTLSDEILETVMEAMRWAAGGKV